MLAIRASRFREDAPMVKCGPRNGQFYNSFSLWWKTEKPRGSRGSARATTPVRGLRSRTVIKNLAKCLVAWCNCIHLQAQIGGYPFPMRADRRSFFVVHANVAQLVEQLICNQPVGGSSPFIGSESRSKGEIPKWPTGADCKSAASQLRRFESCSPHHSVTEPFFRKPATGAATGSKRE